MTEHKVGGVPYGTLGSPGKITPLTDDHNNPDQQHGIRKVLKKWEEEINKLSKYDPNRSYKDSLPSPEFSRQGNNPYYGYPDVWDVSQVTDMSNLFEGKNLQKLFVRPYIDYVSRLTKRDLKSMYPDDSYKGFDSDWMSHKLKGKFERDHFNDGPVANMTAWTSDGDNDKFKIYRRRLPRVFFLHMWDMANVRNTTHMFKNAVFNMNIFNWNFNNLECAEEMFLNTKFFSTPIKFSVPASTEKYDNPIKNIIKTNLITWEDRAINLYNSFPKYYFSKVEQGHPDYQYKQQYKELKFDPGFVSIQHNRDWSDYEKTIAKNIIGKISDHINEKHYGGDNISNIKYQLIGKSLVSIREELFRMSGHTNSTEFEENYEDLPGRVSAVVHDGDSATTYYVKNKEKYQKIYIANDRNMSAKKAFYLAQAQLDFYNERRHDAKKPYGDEDKRKRMFLSPLKFIYYYDREIRQQHNSGRTGYWDKRYYLEVHNKNKFHNTKKREQDILGGHAQYIPHNYLWPEGFNPKKKGVKRNIEEDEEVEEVEQVEQVEQVEEVDEVDEVDEVEEVEEVEQVEQVEEVEEVEQVEQVEEVEQVEQVEQVEKKEINNDKLIEELINYANDFKKDYKSIKNLFNKEEVSECINKYTTRLNELKSRKARSTEEIEYEPIEEYQPSEDGSVNPSQLDNFYNNAWGERSDDYQTIFKSVFVIGGANFAALMHFVDGAKFKEIKTNVNKQIKAESKLTTAEKLKVDQATGARRAKKVKKLFSKKLLMTGGKAVIKNVGAMAISFALWAGWALIDKDLQKAMQDPNNPNPPPGNPFDLEDPRELANIGEQTSERMARDIVCNAGANAASLPGSPLNILAMVTVDLLCYTWDVISYKTDSPMWARNLDPDYDKYIQYSTFYGASGSGLNNEQLIGDYVVGGFLQFQATTLFSTESVMLNKNGEISNEVYCKYNSGGNFKDNSKHGDGRLKDQKAYYFLNPVLRVNSDKASDFLRLRNEYYDKYGRPNPEQRNDKYDFFPSDNKSHPARSPRAGFDDLDWRVKHGYMRKKGRFYIWLENYPKMDNGNGDTTLGEEPIPGKQYGWQRLHENLHGYWNNSVSRYTFIQTNITKSLSSWSIREKNYDTTCVYRGFFLMPRIDSKINKTIDYTISENESIKMQVHNYNLFSLRGMFRNAITDKSLFEPVNFDSESQSLPFLQKDHKYYKEAVALNIQTDLYSLANPSIHSEPVLRPVSYRLYNDETEKYDNINDQDGLRWNLNDFTDFSYFFANTRVIFNYGKAYRVWLDIGSSPAENVEFPYDTYTRRIKEQYMYQAREDHGKGNIVGQDHKGITMPTSPYAALNSLNHSLDDPPKESVNIYALREDMQNLYHIIGGGDTGSFNSFSQYGSGPNTLDSYDSKEKVILTPLPASINFKDLISRTILPGDSKPTDLPSLSDNAMRRRNISRFLWDTDNPRPGDQRNTVEMVLNQKHLTWETRRYSLCKILFQKYIGHDFNKTKFTVQKELMNFVNEDKIIPGFSKDRIRMSSALVEAVKPDNSLPEPDWRLIEKEAVARELNELYKPENHPTKNQAYKIIHWSQSMYNYLRMNDIEILHSTKDKERQKTLDETKQQFPGATIHTDGYAKTNDRVGRLTNHPSIRIGILRKIEEKPLELRILLCYAMYACFDNTQGAQGQPGGKVLWGEQLARLRGKLFRINAEIHYWGNIRRQWDTTHDVVSPNLTGFIGKLPLQIARYESKKYPNGTIMKDSQGKPLYGDPIFDNNYSITFFTNRRLSGARNLQNMFEGCSFSYGYENFYIILEKYANMWNKSQKIKRDLSQLFVNTDFMDRTNNSLSNMDVRCLAVHTIFGDFKRNTIYNEERRNLLTKIPKHWFVKSRISRDIFAVKQDDRNNLLVDYAKMMIGMPIFKNFSRGNKKNENTILDLLNINRSGINQDIGDYRFNYSVEKLKNHWLFKADKFYSQLLAKNYDTSTNTSLNFIKYPLKHKPHEKWHSGKDKSEEQFISDINDLIGNTLALDIYDYCSTEVDRNFLYLETTKDMKRLLISMKLPGVDFSNGDKDNLYITYHEFITWYKNNIVLNDDSIVLNSYKYGYFDNIPDEGMIVDDFSLSNFINKYFLYKTYFNEGLYKKNIQLKNGTKISAWDYWKVTTDINGNPYWFNKLLKENTTDNTKPFNPTWINPIRFNKNKSLTSEKLQKLKIDNVVYFAELFKDKKEFDIDISNWSFSQLQIDYPETYRDMFTNTQVKNKKILMAIIDKLFFLPTKVLNNMGVDKIDTSLIIDMSELFKNGRTASFSLETFERPITINTNYLNIDVSKWDMSNVKNMESMFEGCENFNSDLSNWNTKNVINMKNLFKGCNSFNQDISKWNVKKVKNFHNMFLDVPNLNKAYPVTLKINEYDYNNDFEFDGVKVYSSNDNNKNAIDLNNSIENFYNRYYYFNYYIDDNDEYYRILELFKTYKNYNYVYGKIQDLNTTYVTNMSNSFKLDNTKSQEIQNKLINFNEDLTMWDVSNVKNMESMFHGCENFNHSLSNWNISNVTNMKSMFQECKKFNSDLSNWKIKNVNMESMFHGCENLNSDLSNWNMSNVTNIIGMFYGCTNFNSNLSEWNIEKVKNLINLFYNCENFYSDLSKWNTTNITNMKNMFKGCKKFNSDLFNWNTSNVTNMESMFEGCENFNQYISTNIRINIKNETISPADAVGNNRYVDGKYVYGADKESYILSLNGREFEWKLITNIIKTTKQSTWNTQKVTSMKNMFKNCTKFNQDIRLWDVSNVTDMENIFLNTELVNSEYFKYVFNKQLNSKNKYEFFKYIVEKNENEPKIKDIIGKTKYGPIQNWNTRLVTNMNGLFQNKTDFNEDISKWNTENVKLMNNMFNGATSFNQDIRIWDVRKVTNMTNIFTNATKLVNSKYFKYVTNNELGIKVVKVENKYEFFKYPIEKPEYSINFTNQTYNITPLGIIINNYFLNEREEIKKYGPIENWNVSNVNDMEAIFYAGSRSPTLDLSSDRAEYEVYNKQYIDYNKDKIKIDKIWKKKQKFNKDISEWDVSNVTNMNSIFYGCGKFNQNIKNWDVSNVKIMQLMFGYARSFDKDIRKWNVGNVIDITFMFAGTNAFLIKYFKDRIENIRLITKYDLKYTENVHKYFIFDKPIKPEDLKIMIDEYLQLFYY